MICRYDYIKILEGGYRMKAVKMIVSIILILVIIGLVIMFLHNGCRILPPNYEHRDEILIAMRNIV
jgi:capsular polysaccharide biosynthesis protein